MNDTDSIVTHAKSRELAGENPYRVYIDAKNAADRDMTPGEYERFIRRLCEALEIWGGRRMIKITIPLNPVTKKNHSRIIRCGKYPRVIPSKQFVQYERDAKPFLPFVAAPIAGPVEVECKFYMATRRKVDLTNLLEAVDDILVKYGVLADDNSQIIVSHDGSRVYYDKASPRTEIIIRGLRERGEQNGEVSN